MQCRADFLAQKGNHMAEKNTIPYKRYDVTKGSMVVSRINPKAVESAKKELQTLEGKKYMTSEEKIMYFQLKAFFEGLESCSE